QTPGENPAHAFTRLYVQLTISARKRAQRHSPAPPPAFFTATCVLFVPHGMCGEGWRVGALPGPSRLRRENTFRLSYPGSGGVFGPVGASWRIASACRAAFRAPGRRPAGAPRM